MSDNNKAQDHRDLINKLQAVRETLAAGGGPKRVEIQRAKGKRTARERILQFLDEGSFHEIDAFWVKRSPDFDADKMEIKPDSLIGGYGKVEGRMVCIYAQDFTVMGGSFSDANGQKVAKLLDLAMDSGLPVIGLLDSVGARIQEGAFSLAGYSELFYRNTQASGVVPQISVMLGPCAGGSSYSPGLTDFVIMTEETSHMFITGPKVIESVTGEIVDMDSLGGSKIHNSISGVAHFSAKDEDQALAYTRTLLSYLPSNNQEKAPIFKPDDDPWRMDEALNTIVPVDPAEPYDMKAVIDHIFDRKSFFEVHTHFAPNAIVGFARLHGQSVGLVANQPMELAGVLDINSSDKIARFIRFCDAFNIPLISLIDTPGFMPGLKEEHGGIIRHGAKIVYAYSEATVPKISVIVRKAYGGAYIVMGSKYIHTDMVYGWPTAEVAVMGADGAVNILYSKQLAAADNPEALKQELTDEYRHKFASPYATAASGHLDDILIPSETRPKLIAALELLRDKRKKGPNKKHGNMPM